MSKPIRFLSAAEHDAIQARTWYENWNKEVASRFLRELDTGLDRIEQAPGRYPFYRKPLRMYLLANFPYVIIYQETADVVEIVAVGHTSRKPNYWEQD